MNLILDLGNTTTKAAIFSDGKLLESFIIAKAPQPSDLYAILKQYPQVDAAILSSVVHYPADLKNTLEGSFRFVELSHTTPLPFEIGYETPHTLGRDRIAAIAGIQATFPGQNALVIDMGTCITYDLITAEGHYPGGAISPGLDLRFRSLNTFTDKLPLLSRRKDVELIGKSTEQAILSGVQKGIQAELEGTIAAYSEKHTDLNVLMTGGDADFFVKALKNSIFADPFLVLKGLDVILNYNKKRI